MTPEPDDTVRITLRLRKSLHEWLAEQPEAITEDRSLNWQINDAVGHFMTSREMASPPPFPESEFESSGTRFTATLGWYMPYFDFTHVDDVEDGQLGTEERIERALTECARVLRQWGAQGDVVVHSIDPIQGSQLPTRITNFPRGTTEINKGALGKFEVESDEVVVEKCSG